MTQAGLAERERSRLGGQSLLLALLMLACSVSLAACARQKPTAKLCEPPGTVLQQPDEGEPRYHLADVPPEQLNDGWRVSSLESEGMAPDKIDRLLQAIEGGDFSKVDSVLIARHGKLVLEAYFNGFERDMKHDLQSVTKSVASALVGIAIDRGFIADVDQPLSNFYPERWPKVFKDKAAKSRITLEHLLTMTAGFDAEENWGVGPRRVDDMRRSEDWYLFALDLPLARPPGERFSYNSPTAFLVGGVVAQAAGEPLPAFAKEALFEPLGITDYCWSIAPGGGALTNSDLFMRPRDMAKFGQLYLDQGLWNGRRVISEDWVRVSTNHLVDSARPDPARKLASERGYGYLWWTRRAPAAPDPTFDLFLATGNGGQKIFVFPTLELVVVFTGSHYGKDIGHEQPWGHAEQLHPSSRAQLKEML